MSWKNFCLRLLVRALRPFLRQTTAHGERILVVTTTALGDTLWATPTLESLRTSFPKAYIGVLTSPIGLEVLTGNPHPNQLYLLKKMWIALWKELYCERFDTILLLHASQRLVLPLCALLGARKIVGTMGLNKGLDDVLTDPLPNTKQHEITRRLVMVERIGGRISTETLSLFPQTKEALPPGRWVVLHPGSKDAFKRWPVEQFASIGHTLHQQFDCSILITGTSCERALLEQLRTHIPQAEVRENLPLHSFAALLQSATLLVSNDTGPVHIACALNCPVIALYGPTDPALCGPHLAPNALAIAKSTTCTPCLKRACRRPFCLLQISPEEVVAACIKKMKLC